MYAIMKTVESTGFFEERVMRMCKGYSDATDWISRLKSEKMKQKKFNTLEFSETRLVFEDATRKVEIFIKKLEVEESSIA